MECAGDVGILFHKTLFPLLFIDADERLSHYEIIPIRAKTSNGWMMGTFTMHDDPRVDKKIQKDLDVIVAEILATMSPVTILLTGSFGRGEGSVLIHGDQVIKLNDYDIFIITNKGSLLPYKKIRDLWNSIETRCGFSEFENQYIFGKNKLRKHVELTQFTSEQFLITAHHMICDVMRGSKVIYGRDIREEIELDLQKMALSSVYFSMLKNLKLLLNNFSIEYYTSPPGGIKRFSLIFLCCKVYMSMEVQLTLCHDLSHPSSRVRAKRLKESYPHLYPELAKEAPDLLERIHYASELRLFPEAIEDSPIDPVNMWFETQRDLDHVMRYCLKIFAQADSDDWTVLSDRFYQSLCHDYHFYQIEHYLNKQFGIQSPAFSSLGNLMYQHYDTHRYFIYILKKKKIRLDLFMLSPVFKILAISPLLLFSLHEDGSVDRTLFTEFCRNLSFLFPNLGDEIKEPTADNWEFLKNRFLGEISAVDRILNP